LRGLKFIDLFCGIGGFRQALEGVGHSCVFSSDWDRQAQWVYEMNYGELPVGDLAAVSEEQVPPHDILCGGFPCQPFSISGNQHGFRDARGTLLFEIIRIVRVHRPLVLLLENVRNYLRHDQGNTMRVTLDLLSRAGYSVHHAVLNASMFGVPQKRERLFFVCFRDDLESATFSFPPPFGRVVALDDILLPAGDPRLDEFMVDRSDIRIREDLPRERQNRPLRVGTLGKGGQGERIYSTKGHAVTLSAYGGGAGAKTGLYLVGDRVRRLHPVECQRAMGFPETFRLHPRSNVCFQQFGNSVAVPVIRAVLQQIHEVLGLQKMAVA